MKKISVVIPTYNREALLGRAVESVLAQTFQDLEVIVIDDGSTDGTRDLVQGYGERILYEFQENQGASSARNRGIALSQGEYVAFLDSDDYFAGDNLETKLSFLEKHPQVGWVYSDWQYVDQKGAHLEKGSRKFRYIHKMLTGMIFEDLLRYRNYISTCTVVIRKSVLDKVGSFDPLIPSQEEYDLWLRVSREAPAQYIDRALVYVTLQPDSLSRDFSKWVEGNTRIVDKLRNLIPCDFPNRKKLLAKLEADKYTFMASDFVQKGQIRDALIAYLHSARRLPLQKRVYWLMVLAVMRLFRRW